MAADAADFEEKERGSAAGCVEGLCRRVVREKVNGSCGAEGS